METGWKFVRMSVCGMEGGSKCRREGGKGIEVRKLGGLTTCPGACIGIRQPKAAIISSNKAI